MLPVPTLFMVAMAGLALITVVVLVSTGSLTAAFVVLVLAGVLGFLLFQLGVLDIKTSPTGTDITFHEQAPAPAMHVMAEPKSLEKQEVFYVGGNDYTYDEAPALCAAYGGDLATYDQVNEAYEAGAEWCGYGWTQGGMALFPTQQDTWNALQQETDMTKRTACGRPGVNGGYFNPTNKFGVNCYGVKPRMHKNMKFPLPVPGMDTAQFDKMVDKFKGMLSRISVSAFNRAGWSEWNAKSHTQGLPQIKVGP